MSRGIVVLIGLGLGLVLGSCGQPGPGVAIEWGKNAAAPHVSEGPVAVAMASPALSTPGAESSGIWAGLNRNTAEVARGEYAIIQQLERALELQITGMLPKR